MNEFNQVANIKVFGIGGGGSNAVNRMVADGVKGVTFSQSPKREAVRQGLFYCPFLIVSVKHLPPDKIPLFLL